MCNAILLSVVTDDELLASQIVKTIFLVILSGGIIFNLIQFFRTENRKRKVISAGALLILSVVSYFVFNAYRVEGSLRNEYQYVPGITIGYCTKFALGEGIEFEYEVNGKKYSNCNTFHPISKDSIIVPGGKYSVRCSDKYPDEGRMNFKMRME